MTFRNILAATLVTLALFTAQHAFANASPSAKQAAGLVASNCLVNWSAPLCLSAISTSNMTMLGNYGALLQERGQPNAAEAVKQFCAASTAAQRQPYPAYAMLSAFKDCANTISDITEKTGLAPDASHYQLLVSAIMCLSGDPACAGINAGLRPYISRKLQKHTFN